MKPSASCSVPAVSRMVTAGIDPDADLHLHALRAAKLLRMVPYDLLHPEGGIAGPHRMVRMGKRRTDAILQKPCSGPELIAALCDILAVNSTQPAPV